MLHIQISLLLGPFLLHLDVLHLFFRKIRLTDFYLWFFCRINKSFGKRVKCQNWNQNSFYLTFSINHIKCERGM